MISFSGSQVIISIDDDRGTEGIIGWLTVKLSFHGYFPKSLIVNISREYSSYVF